MWGGGGGWGWGWGLQLPKPFFTLKLMDAELLRNGEGHNQPRQRIPADIKGIRCEVPFLVDRFLSYCRM